MKINKIYIVILLVINVLTIKAQQDTCKWSVGVHYLFAKNQDLNIKLPTIEFALNRTIFPSLQVGVKASFSRNSRLYPVQYEPYFIDTALESHYFRKAALSLTYFHFLVKNKLNFRTGINLGLLNEIRTIKGVDNILNYPLDKTWYIKPLQNYFLYGISANLETKFFRNVYLYLGGTIDLYEKNKIWSYDTGIMWHFN